MTKHLSFDDGEYRAEIDIRPATTGDGIRRERDMYENPSKDPLELRAKQLLITLTAVADIQTLTKAGKSIKLNVDTLLDLPGALTTLWSMYVFEANPHWNFGLTTDQLEAIQKKASPPSAGLPDSTEPQPKAANPKT